VVEMNGAVPNPPLPKLVKSIFLAYKLSLISEDKCVFVCYYDRYFSGDRRICALNVCSFFFCF